MGFPTISNPSSKFNASDTPRGLAFDVDGTLYHQGLLRACMAAELAASVLTLGSTARHQAMTAWRRLAVFRRSREALKGTAAEAQSLDRLQYEGPAQTLGCSPDDLEAVVRDWMHVRPLRYLSLCRRRGLVAFFRHLVTKGYRVAVLSDYPATEKLEALGIAQFVHVTLCATDTTVNALKPHPKGFLQVCDALGLPPADVLYVGDRPEVDLVGAQSAGMRCVLMGSRLPWRGTPRHLTFPTFRRLQYELDL